MTTVDSATNPPCYNLYGYSERAWCSEEPYDERHGHKRTDDA